MGKQQRAVAKLVKFIRDHPFMSHQILTKRLRDLYDAGYQQGYRRGKTFSPQQELPLTGVAEGEE